MKKYVEIKENGEPIEGTVIEMEEKAEEKGFFGKLGDKLKGINPKTAAKAGAGFLLGLAAGAAGSSLMAKSPKRADGPIEADYYTDEPYTVDSPEVADLLPEEQPTC